MMTASGGSANRSAPTVNTESRRTDRLEPRLNRDCPQVSKELLVAERRLRFASRRLGDERGFNAVELALVLMTILIVMGEGLPSLQSYLRSSQAAGDAKGISSQLSLARMRSASDFTQARLRFNLADKSYQLETFDKT